MLNVILMAKWGIGIEIAKTLLDHSDVRLRYVITQYRKNETDKWYNAVFNYCLQNDVNVVREQSLNFSRLRQNILNSGIELLIVHSFMKKLPRDLYLAPKFGTVNVHASLLPKYRGPSPNYWVLKNKERFTGVTTHYVAEGIDEGDIIEQSQIAVKPEDTEDTLIEKEKLIVGDLIRKTLVKMQDKDFKALPQQNELSTYAPRPANDKAQNQKI